MNVSEMYVDGEYLRKNPTWDAEDAPWKADLIFRILKKNGVMPETVCEVGCGCGEILRQLQVLMPPNCMFTGYEISPQAIDLCRQRGNARLQFRLKNFTDETGTICDLILLIDLIEHLEDYFEFLRRVKGKSEYKVLHIPLEMYVLAMIYTGFLLRQRQKVGHLHFFSKDLALQLLSDLGYKILDFSYTPGYSLPRDFGLKDKLLKIPRKLLFPFAPDLTVRIFGGYSLLVLVK